MKELTKAEEQVMHIVWKLKKAFLKDIVDAFDEPKPAYTTISTVVRVLVKKGFLAFDSYGKVNQYFATISKEKYFSKHLNGIIHNFFDGSTKQFASFFANNQKLSLSELEQMKQLLESKIDDLKKEDD